MTSITDINTLVKEARERKQFSVDWASDIPRLCDAIDELLLKINQLEKAKIDELMTDHNLQVLGMTLNELNKVIKFAQVHGYESKARLP